MAVELGFVDVEGECLVLPRRRARRSGWRALPGRVARARVLAWLACSPQAELRLRGLMTQLGELRAHEPAPTGAELRRLLARRLGDPGPRGLVVLVRPRKQLPPDGRILEPPPPPVPLEPETEPSWIFVRLIDPEGEPRADEAYEVELPDGSVRTGRLDARGSARLDDIPPGRCKWRFPELHPDEWRA